MNECGPRETSRIGWGNAKGDAKKGKRKAKGDLLAKGLQGYSNPTDVPVLKRCDISNLRAEEVGERTIRSREKQLTRVLREGAWPGQMT